MTSELTPEENTILKNADKQILKYFILPIIGVVLAIIIGISFMDATPEKSNDPLRGEVVKK